MNPSLKRKKERKILLNFTRVRHRCSSSFPSVKSSFQLTGSNSSFIFGKVCERLVSSCSLAVDTAKEMGEGKTQETTSQQQLDVWRQVDPSRGRLTELLKRPFGFFHHRGICAQVRV